MKEFRFIETKDPYENISPINLIVRRYDGIKTLIEYSRCSFLYGLLLFIIFESPLYNILEQSGTLGMVMIAGSVTILAVALPGIFMGLIFWIIGFVKFFYNLINKKIIGVDLYSDIVNFLDDFVYKLNEMDKEDYENDEYDDYDYDYEEDDEDYEDDIIE